MTEPVEEKMNVHEAINAVSSGIGAMAKNGVNKHQNYNFRGIDQLVTAVQPLLNEYGVTIVPSLVSHESADRPTDGKTQRWCTVVVNYTITGPAGDSIVATMVGEANDTADKAMAKALSFAAKYFYFQTFWFGVEGMEDGDKDHNEGGRTYGGGQSSGARSGAKQASSSGSGGDITDPQVKAINSLSGKVLKWDDAKLYSTIAEVVGREVAAVELLTKAEASSVITALQEEAN